MENNFDKVVEMQKVLRSFDAGLNVVEEAVFQAIELNLKALNLLLAPKDN